MDKRGIWIAFGIGVSAGAAIALLYAPQSGAATRKRLRGNIEDGVEYLEDAADYLKEQADYLSKEAQKLVKRTKGQVSDIVDTATNTVTSAAKSVQALM
jgi:gas vesicle protein